jgi:hypothetical protein
VQLLEVKVMETPVSSSGLGCGDALLPLIGPEEAVEIRDLVRMADKPIDFLVNEIDENLATAMG